MAKNENLSLDSITMPYSLETEQAVIGSILINPECVTVVLSQVKPDYFYIPQHREIMEAVMILDTLGSRIDALTILDKLIAREIPMQKLIRIIFSRLLSQFLQPQTLKTIVKSLEKSISCVLLLQFREKP